MPSARSRAGSCCRSRPGTRRMERLPGGPRQATARSRAGGAARSLGYQPLERPLGMLAQELVVVLRVPPGEARVAAGVAERDERVPAQVARIVVGHEEPVVALGQPVVGSLEPVDERDVRLRARRRLEARTAFLDPAVPRTDVLADVAAVDLRA